MPFYYKEIAPYFPAPVTFIRVDVQKILLYLKCSPNIPLQKSHSALYCQSTLYIFFWGFCEIGCVTSLFWPTCDTLLLISNHLGKISTFPRGAPPNSPETCLGRHFMHSRHFCTDIGGTGTTKFLCLRKSNDCTSRRDATSPGL